MNSNFEGFFIRIMLLSGSRFKKQLIPDTFAIFPLAFLGVIFSAAMQFVLAWYLWTRLPPSYPQTNGDNANLKPYPGTEAGRGYYESSLAFARSPLPANQYPNYQVANDICRTAPVVQLVCIGLFLFSILNNVPGIMKNIAIIWASERFISEDEDGVTKLHYWRESDYSREPENRFLMRFCNERLRDSPLDQVNERSRLDILVFICEMYFKGSILTSGKKQLKRTPEQGEDVKLFAAAARRRWMLPTYFPAVQPRASWRKIEEEKKEAKKGLKMKEEIPRSFFEVNETRSFLAEALRLIDNEHNVKPVGIKEKLVEYDKVEGLEGLDLNKRRGVDQDLNAILEPQSIQFCDEARFNLVRVDYLKPSAWLRPLAYRAAKASKDSVDESAGQGAAGTTANPARLEAIWALMQGRSSTPSEKTFFKLLMTQLGKQFSDLPTAVRLLQFPAHMRRFRFFAFLLGVLPEIATLTMIAVAGIPYILWSGFKVSSDTQGMEEIILATLAIVFIYDIDDSVYEHILPELYKEAHERDRFELSRGWISSETAGNLAAIAQRPRSSGAAKEEKEGGKAKPDAKKAKQEDKRIRRLMRCHPLVWVVKREPKFLLIPDDPVVDATLGTINGPGVLRSASLVVERLEDSVTYEELGTTAERDGSESPKVQQTEEEKKEWEERLISKGMKLLMRQFDKGMAGLSMTADRALAMSVSDHWNDLYLARAYPFLYARKLRYALAGHLWERFLVFYGSVGLHYLVLVCITVIIVAGYRSLAHCERFAPQGSSYGIFGAQPWPSTCLLGVGQTADKFSLLNGSSADKFMAVSCGVSGYIPGPEEWQKNIDFLTKDDRR
jgi:hypothetical protein